MHAVRRAVGLIAQRAWRGVRWRLANVTLFVADVGGPYLRASRRPRFRPCEESDVIVALTTWRERIGSVWAVLDSLFEQDADLAAVVLVLSREEFPRERVPRTLTRRLGRGLTLLWVDEDNKSFDKLLPALRAFPSSRVITVDDDKLYGRRMASELIAASDRHPNAIIGHKARWMQLTDSGELMYGIGPGQASWPLATPETPSEAVFFIGAGGILYPPGSLSSEVQDVALARRLCPTADDQWFWAMSVLANAPRMALGSPKPRKLRRQQRTAALNDINQGPRNAEQMRALVSHFELTESVIDPLRRAT